MSTLNIIRAWKDEEYRLGLSEAERALLPENPAGLIELADADLETVGGGLLGTLALCTEVTARCPSVCQVFSC